MVLPGVIFFLAFKYIPMLGSVIAFQDYSVFKTILDKGIMPSEKVLDFPVDCNTLTGSVNL